jgi:Ca2+-binding RTX toxin-like protein
MITRASFESLEQRQHLSATLKDGVLTIAGTRRSDDYLIYVANRSAADGLVIVVNHRQNLHFNSAEISRIDIELGLGNDNVNFTVSTLAGHILLPVDIPVTVRGGAGNDTLSGSGKADLLDGGDGNDALYPQGGDNTVLGGAGNDRIDVYAGNNVLRGGAGDDTIIARGNGDNLLSGDSGDDSLIGGDGDDLIMGGPGADTLDGSGGYDRIFGNRGDDSFVDFADSSRQRRDLQPGERVFIPKPVDPIIIIN